MPRYKLIIEYDGAPFFGWQVQETLPSVQGALEAAVKAMTGADLRVHGAGRTDAGVHALGQVASAAVTCAHPVDTIGRGLNAQLPADIRLLSVVDAPPDFHARFSARRKTYRYLLRTAPFESPFERRFVWHIREPLDVPQMQRAAATICGTHDFDAFRSAGSSVRTTTRTIFASGIDAQTGSVGPFDVIGGASLLAYEIEGDGFLRHMVRAIVGTLVEIGRGWRDSESMSLLLAGGVRAQAGATAPPHGLYLVRVDYD